MDDKDLPQDAKIVEEMLKIQGVTEFEPRVVEQMMDFMYRYTAEVLHESKAVAAQFGGPAGEIGAQDVTDAIQAKTQHSFVPPPPQEVLFKLAEERNKQPLPELRPRHGLRIPPEADCLLNPNFQPAPPAAEPSGGAPVDAAAAAQRQHSSYNVRQDHRLGISVPAEGWQPPEDAAAEPWPGAQQSTEQEEQL